MKLYQIITLLILGLFCSCKGDKAEETNTSFKNEIDNIKGQAIIGESSRSINYSPKGNFIKVILPDTGLWRSLNLEKSNNLISSKLFFDDNDINESYLFDSLDLGEYQIKFISGFKDTIEEKLNLNKNTVLSFPKGLTKFYNEVDIEDLSINKLRQNDTLQLLYQNHGCFGNSESLTEFIFITDNIIVQRLYDKSENHWIYVENINNKVNLNDFVSKLKGLKQSELNLCSSDEFYIFRKKGLNKTSIVYNKSCELIDEIHQILNPK